MSLWCEGGGCDGDASEILVLSSPMVMDVEVLGRITREIEGERTCRTIVCFSLDVTGPVASSAMNVRNERFYEAGSRAAAVYTPVVQSIWSISQFHPARSM